MIFLYPLLHFILKYFSLDDNERVEECCLVELIAY